MRSSGRSHAGSKRETIAPLGSYEAWSSVVRASLVWAGCDDPLANRDRTLAVADVEGASLAELLAELANVAQPFTAQDVARAAVDGTALRDALVALHGEKPSTPRRVGGVLARFRGRVADGSRLVHMGDDDRSRVTVWRVERMEVTR